MSEQRNAAFYIELFNQSTHRVKELDSAHYNKEFCEAWGLKDPTAPIVLMFNSFVAGVEMGEEISAKANAETTTQD